MNKEIGFIGLGRMGLHMSARLHEQGYRVVGIDPNEHARNKAAELGIAVSEEYGALVTQLRAPRVVWLMVPSALVDEVLSGVTPLLEPGDAIIDGGNSFYEDSLRRFSALHDNGITFLDCGTSGGVGGARGGASLMIGAQPDVFASHEDIFKALAAPDAYARVGGPGAGHFVKMVHNGIEYGMMGAIAEGFSVLHDAREELGIDLQEIFKPYQHGSIIESSLLPYLKAAYDQGQIEQITGEVPQGETEREMEHLVTLGQMAVLAASLSQRKQTRETPSYLGTLIAAMRNQFGGHSTLPKQDQ